KVERHSFSLAQSMVRSGEFQYAVSGQQTNDGQHKAALHVKLGLTRSLTGSLGLVRDPVSDSDEVYLSTGLRSFWRTVSIGGDFIQTNTGGSLLELNAQTRIRDVLLNGSRLYLDDFVSNQFPESTNPIRTRDNVRVSLTLPLNERVRLPFTLAATRDTRYSGMVRNDISARISANVYRSTVTNTVHWRSSDTASNISGNLQISRRVGATNLRGRTDYTLGSDPGITSLGLSGDRYLWDGYRVAAGISHSLSSHGTNYTVGLNKNLGRFGLALNARFNDRGAFTVGARLFSAAARNPQSSDWVFDARPMANTGAVSVQVFVDSNDNGVKDPEDQPLEDVGFIVNNSRHPAQTDASGVAHIGQLSVTQQVNIEVDEATLIDPQWLPTVTGLKILARPGRTARVNIPVRVATEIDGTTYLWDKSLLRGIGGLQLVLQDANNVIVARGVSSWDGFYIIPDVLAGDYWLRVAPSQLRQLGLEDTGTRKLSVSGDGTFINGVDLIVMSSIRREPGQIESHPVILEQTGFRTEPWINQQDASRYTIQLVAASTESSVRRYIERHDLTETSAYFHTVRNGSSWYSVIYGRFSTYEEARLALAQLPNNIAGASPWLREFSEIQKKIAEGTSVE
ncbi:MAG: SPOR domain-containing protein, partial [Natronospirillum sp.]